MNKSVAQRYMKTTVFTATPEQLQLMLYDGGIRFAEMGRAALLEKNFEQSFKYLSRAQRIVMELTGTLRHDVAPAICKNLAAIYAFVYRRLTEANSQRKIEALDEAVRLLKYQRETWVLLMQQTGKQKAAQAAQQIPDVPPPSERMEATISLQG
jgi:flagellar protein FliS